MNEHIDCLLIQNRNKFMLMQFVLKIINTVVSTSSKNRMNLINTVSNRRTGCFKCYFARN